MALPFLPPVLVECCRRTATPSGDNSRQVLVACRAPTLLAHVIVTCCSALTLSILPSSFNKQFVFPSNHPSVDILWPQYATIPLWKFNSPKEWYFLLNPLYDNYVRPHRGVIFSISCFTTGRLSLKSFEISMTPNFSYKLRKMAQPSAAALKVWGKGTGSMTSYADSPWINRYWN